MHPLIGPALVAVGLTLCLASAAASRYTIDRDGQVPLAPTVAGYLAVIAGAIILAAQ